MNLPKQLQSIVPAIAVAAVLAAGPACAQEVTLQRSITVQGLGEVAAKPDQATLVAGVISTGKTAQEALAKNNDDVAKLFAALKAQGIPDKDIQTSNFSVSPRYARYEDRDTPPDIVGYQVSNTVRVTVADLSTLGDTLDKFVSDGAANMLSGIQFGFADASDLENEARVKAIEDAKAKAQLYAQTAGVKLGSVLTINESGVSVPQPMFMQAERALASSVPVATGESEVSARITVTFALD